MLAILPLMALAILAFSRTGTSRPKVQPPREGVLIVASLRGESLVIRDLQVGGPASMLALSGPPHELLAAGGRLYATLGRGNALLEVEPAAPAVLRSLALDGEPHGLALSGQDLLVTLDRARALVTVDRATFAETARLDAGDTPHIVATEAGRAYLVLSREDRVTMAGSTASGHTGSLPESLAVTGGLVVTGDHDARQLSLFDAATLAPLGTVRLGGSPVRVLPLDATHVLAALGDTSEVVVVDLVAREVTRRLKVKPHPDGICFSPSGDYVAVVSNAEDAVQVFEVRYWRLALTLQAGAGPGACAWLPHH
jgi:DNA-binding beta-propeller fold protein YncE